MNNMKILGTGRSLPEKVLTNCDLEKMVETSDEWITTRTGIKERRIADEHTATSDLSTEAAEKAMQAAGISAEALDCIMVATVTPDMAFPSTACIVQKNIEAFNACAFDLEAACTGFLYGLVIADQFVKSGTYKHILVIGAETLSKITDWEDRSTCVLFGDGAGAAVLGPTSAPDRGLVAYDLGADGTKGELLMQPAGGSRKPTCQETLDHKGHYIKMQGNEVFKFAVKVIGDTAEKSLAQIQKKADDVDLFIPHQANHRIISAALNRLGFTWEKTYVNVDRFGNMSAASIPVALDEALEKSLIQSGNLIALVGFGGGLTWGSCIFRWP